MKAVVSLTPAKNCLLITAREGAIEEKVIPLEHGPEGRGEDDLFDSLLLTCRRRDAMASRAIESDMF
jgi:hypothetical protein